MNAQDSGRQNMFKAGLVAGRRQIGLWLSLADPIAAEICAGAGFDWLLIDAEHAPNDLRTVLSQLQAIRGGASTPIVRPVCQDPALLKQYLDLGAQTLLVPMVDNAAQARELVRAVRYPPAGIRGVATARAARWGRYADYFEWANREICLVVQVESAAGVASVESIAAVEGVDAVFVGPSDLGAALGYLGQPSHPEVRAAVVDVIGRVRALGKPAGVLATTSEAAEDYLKAGASFVGVGIDTILLARTASDLAASFRSVSSS